MNLELRVEDETPTDLAEWLANGIPRIIPAIGDVRITRKSFGGNRTYSLKRAEVTLAALLSKAAEEVSVYSEHLLVAADDIDGIAVNEPHHLFLRRQILYQNIGREFVDFSKNAAKDELLLRVAHSPYFFVLGHPSMSEIYRHRFGNKFETQCRGISFREYQSAVAAFTLAYTEPLRLASHELGHNFGLYHHRTDDPNCIMAVTGNTYCGPCKDKIMEVKEKGSFRGITL